MLTEFLRTTIKGVSTLRALIDSWDSLSRHICDSPRTRHRRNLSDLQTLENNYQSLS